MSTRKQHIFYCYFDQYRSIFAEVGRRIASFGHCRLIDANTAYGRLGGLWKLRRLIEAEAAYIYWICMSMETEAAQWNWGEQWKLRQPMKAKPTYGSWGGLWPLKRAMETLAVYGSRSVLRKQRRPMEVKRPVEAWWFLEDEAIWKLRRPMEAQAYSLRKHRRSMEAEAANGSWARLCKHRHQWMVRWHRESEAV